MNPIICALDTQDLNKAISLANALRGKVGMVKLGLEFFAAHGLSGVQEVAKCNVPIFLDLKLHDIPNTVAKTVEVIKVLNVEMLTLHISGGTKMLEEALSVVQGTKIKLIGVTVLTSMSNEDLNELGVAREVKSQVILLAKLAKKIGLYGIVCSALEAQEVRQECGEDFKIITPGIRIDPGHDDQKRTATPRRKIDNNKHVELKNKEFHKEIEKLSKEKEELCKEIGKLCKEKYILYNKKEELYKRQEELYVELDELQCRFKEINQKNKNLSQELKKKFEELDEANDLIENQSFKLDGIRKDCNNEVKSLKNLLLKQDAQIEQLEKDLLREKEEKVSYVERITEYMLCKLEESIKRSKVIKNDDKTVILQEIPVMKSVLEEVVQDLRGKTSGKDSGYASSPGETSVPLHAGDPGYESEEDSGYGSPNSCLSTPTKITNFTVDRTL